MNKSNERWFPFETNGKTYYLPKECPHRGGRLDLGYLNSEKGLVVCPLHKSTFCVPGGHLMSGPASAGLEVVGKPPRRGSAPKRPAGDAENPEP